MDAFHKLRGWGDAAWHLYIEDLFVPIQDGEWRGHVSPLRYANMTTIENVNFINVVD